VSSNFQNNDPNMLALQIGSDFFEDFTVESAARLGSELETVTVKIPHQTSNGNDCGAHAASFVEAVLHHPPQSPLTIEELTKLKPGD